MELGKMVNAAVWGGALLGGGGGGSKEDGLVLARLAAEVGEPTLISIEDVPEDKILVTVGLVGSPASKDARVKPSDYCRALQILLESLDDDVSGIISNENGAVGTVNGWFQSAITGIPVVDAPCNGRAHPTGTMGSMGLDSLPGYQSVQAFSGGDRQAGRHVEGVVRGSLGSVARLLRESAVIAGGLVAVARNPVHASYVKENGAPGGIEHAIQLGRLIESYRAQGGDVVAERCAASLGGQVVLSGTIAGVALETRSGFDVGQVVVREGGLEADLKFWNEYMTLTVLSPGGGRERVATFPDLIATVEQESGLPVTTAEIREGMKVSVLAAPKERLHLGAGMRRPDLMRQVESVIGEDIIRYAFQ